MNELIVLAVSAVPIGAGAVLGHRAGIRRTLLWASVRLLPLVGGGLVAAWLFQAGIFEPFGLLTPVVAGLLVFVLCRWSLPKVARTGGRASSRLADHPRPELGVAGRLAGAAVGGCSGACMAVSGWLLLILAEGLLLPRGRAPPTRGSDTTEAGETPATREATPPSPSGAGELLHDLLRTANRGFVRHVPVVGPLGDEVEAVTHILNADVALRARLARDLRWERLADLPSYRDIARDRELQDDLRRLAHGNLWALYRLQRNPRVLAFWKEREVQEAILGLRPSDLARRLDALDGVRGGSSAEGSDRGRPAGDATVPAGASGGR
jgi:hypothetical protein